MSAYFVPVLNVLFLFGLLYAGKKSIGKFIYTKEELAKDLTWKLKSGGRKNV